MKLKKAIDIGDIEATKQAIAAGANVNAKIMNDGHKESPLYIVVQLLNDSPGSPGHKEIAELLIANGADVNARTHTEHTPLHDASCINSETVELLLANGADVNAKRVHGWTPLQEAAYSGHAENAKLLIAAGSDVNAKNDDGETPLDQALEYALPENKKVADLLRRHGGKTGEELKAEGK